ncbi:MAG: shikimate dehydrogenase [Promethearchaeota archaeon Loki_b32]|nr:MAG: shikimate dehydrogenase [Candidatus Lokiarchaeota archaeon Loki_b32]
MISSHTKVLCVIGYPIEHSMSPIMHNAVIRELKLNYIYLAFKVSPNNLNLAVKGFRAFNIKGINVTLPFKQKIMNYLDDIDPIAQKIGAVNAIKNDNGNLSGRNTDAEAAKNALINAGYTTSGKNLLILGAGGAARALTYILAEDINKIIIANRTEKRAIKLAKELKKNFSIKVEGKRNSISVLKEESKKADILINTTPLGMYPSVEKSPIPAEFLHKDLIVYDIVYNPLETKLMKDATKIGCNTIGGLDMLVNQGALAFEWWTNKKPNIDLMKNKIIEFLGMK